MIRCIDVSTVDRNPIKQFQRWLDDAIAACIVIPNAMTLATATPDGKPSARLVLLKHADDRGFVFYTNYNSRKGRELALNPYAALVFSWIELERQVRIEGIVEKVPPEEADVYFTTRPRDSQLSAHASPQSEVIESRNVLDHRMKELSKQYRSKDVPRPPHWGGYRLVPSVIEFWQGRKSRLHDRIEYRRSSDGAWDIRRLAP